MKITMKDGTEFEVWDGKEVFGEPLSDYALQNHRLDYRALMGLCDNMILNNEVIRQAGDFELENGSDYDEETDEYVDVYQYYIIGENDAQRLERWTNELVYYSPSLDMYLLGVTHFGTAWSYVLTEFDLTA